MPDPKAIAGFAAVLGMLALSSSGVRVARAEDALVSHPSLLMSVDEPVPASLDDSAGSAPLMLPLPVAGPACSPDATADVARARHGVIADLRARLEADAAAGGEDVVVLNGRGYNYGPAPRVDPNLIELEARAQRERTAR